jgi:hypothetical protein
MIAAGRSGATAIFPLEVKESWFKDYWYSDRPRAKRRSPGKRLTGLTVYILLALGSAVTLSHFLSGDLASHLHGGTHVRLM